MSILAILLTLLLNAGVAPAVQYEDEPVVAVMADVAIGALIEAQPACDAGTTSWDFNRDESGGLSVVGKSTACEFAGWFYRSPETGRWTFAVEGS